MEQQLFTIKEECAILRVSRPTVYEMIRAGRIQRVYIGEASPRITREGLESLKQPVESPECFPQAVLGCGIQVGPEED